ncbi:MAG: ABC transporter ATP-binding protein [Aigarchaeota archaeon]|nr:ABC transporter ATP-binding protein [Candidatus Pelearchaeum maunauluense]
MSLLKVENATKRFGGNVAVNSMSLEVNEGEIVGIIGPNGSGKTTLLNLINGIIQLDSGAIYLRGKPIHNKKPHQLVRLGIGRTFQITRVFRELTVLENMLSTVETGKSGKNNLVENALKLLELVGLSDKLDARAGTLSGGQQKLLELARTLMLNPTLLLLDEPFAGVHPKIVMKLSELILDMRKKGKTFLIISHDIHTISWLSDRLVVMNEGRKVAEGSPEQIKQDREVVRAYLGV